MDNKDSFDIGQLKKVVSAFSTLSEIHQNDILSFAEGLKRASDLQQTEIELKVDKNRKGNIVKVGLSPNSSMDIHLEGNYLLNASEFEIKELIEKYLILPKSNRRSIQFYLDGMLLANKNEAGESK